MLFETGWIQVCVMSSSMCWGVPLSAHLVDHTDYPVTDLLQMMDHASRPLLDNSGKCANLCHAPLIENKQDAVDYLTWTFMYGRLTQNLNYYNLQGVSHRHLSDHLSELVENTLNDLEASKCVVVEEDVELSPLNLGMIASYYYISYTTIERFSSLLSPKTKMKGLLEILASASEYALLSIRPGEEEFIRKLINHQSLPLMIPNARTPMLRLILFYKPISQGMSLPDGYTGHVGEGFYAFATSAFHEKELAKKCQENPGKSIETVFDLAELEDDERQELLQMPDPQLMDIARSCNHFPNSDLTYDVVDGDNVRAGEDVSLHVTLERDLGGNTEVGPVDSPRYPKTKGGGWWLLVGDTKVTGCLPSKKFRCRGKPKSSLISLLLEKLKRGRIPSTLCVILTWVVTRNIAFLLM
ncbi:hypothetical protein Vadar_020837 [Vaccinium darrowii]|uniref:Uncharacterized protein n=1 Tax=Vaccinium darrowii TaxID=229202 RepID=A0ACB7YFE1_9ERIC|nr:hypothetical protein Vadar_020837 [Vaccinium darrowii]